MGEKYCQNWDIINHEWLNNLHNHCMQQGTTWTPNTFIMNHLRKMRRFKQTSIYGPQWRNERQINGVIAVYKGTNSYIFSSLRIQARVPSDQANVYKNDSFDFILHLVDLFFIMCIPIALIFFMWLICFSFEIYGGMIVMLECSIM